MTFGLATTTTTTVVIIYDHSFAYGENRENGGKWEKTGAISWFKFVCPFVQLYRARASEPKALRVDDAQDVIGSRQPNWGCMHVHGASKQAYFPGSKPEFWWGPAHT